MSTAKKKASLYLLVGSTIAGECFPDQDGKSFVVRLNRGTNLSWRSRKKLRLLPTLTGAIPSRLPAQSIA
jgi:hypothetical protein